jgi:adenylosuccinate lyase
MPIDGYESPLATRNASKEMQRLFSQSHRVGLWRRLWVELARAQLDLGVKRISLDAIREMEAKLDDIDFESAAEWEKRLRHDVMAHVHTFEEAAPAAKGIIHLGATSQFVVDNADLIIMRDAMRLLCVRLANVIDALGSFAHEYRDLPTLGYTHFQPAQLVTVGKRATLWAQDFVLDLQELEHRLATLRFRGCKGTTGTQASFLTLFNGNHEKCDELDRRLTMRFGFDESFDVTGQTYPRKVDAQIAAALAGVATSVHKFANDIRLLAGLKQVEEPFESEQVGSSAMAYKRNPMRCERATGLARFVLSLMTSPFMTAAEQWFERTLDDSSNKRLAIPEAFLAIDGALMICMNVSRGLVVYPETIARAVRDELPFMATEEILMEAVRRGGDRQELHERLRKHSLASAENVKVRGGANDLIDRLKSDASFSGIDFDGLLDARKFVGRAGEQVARFNSFVVDPIRARYAGKLGMNVDLRV